MERALQSDVFLIERCQQGDRRAFDALMERHQARAFQYALKLTKHAEEASDVVSEGFVRVFRAINQFRSNSAFTTWLYRILRNCFLDMRKKKTLKISASLDSVRETEDGELHMQVVDRGMSPHEHAVKSDHSSKVRMAIARLTVIQRNMIILYHAEQYSYEEIASRLGLPVGTVKSRLNRARIALKDILSSEPELIQA